MKVAMTHGSQELSGADLKLGTKRQQLVLQIKQEPSITYLGQFLPVFDDLRLKTNLLRNFLTRRIVELRRKTFVLAGGNVTWPPRPPNVSCFTAMVTPCVVTPLKTFPKPPSPSRFVGEKLSVAARSSSYVNRRWLSPNALGGRGGAWSGETIAGDSGWLFGSDGVFEEGATRGGGVCHCGRWF